MHMIMFLRGRDLYLYMYARTPPYDFSLQDGLLLLHCINGVRVEAQISSCIIDCKRYIRRLYRSGMGASLEGIGSLMLWIR